MLVGKIVRIRWVKPYHEAHNHIAIGVVVGETANYLTLHGKTYHFGGSVGGQRARLAQDRYVSGIAEGEKAVRSVPWSRIEVINELPASTDWDVEAQVNESGLCVLMNANRTVVTRMHDRQPV